MMVTLYCRRLIALGRTFLLCRMSNTESYFRDNEENLCLNFETITR